MGVNYPKIIPYKRFSSGKQEMETTGISDLIKECEYPACSHFGLRAVPAGRLLAKIAVNASEVASVGKVDAAGKRDALQ